MGRPGNDLMLGVKDPDGKCYDKMRGHHGPPGGLARGHLW